MEAAWFVIISAMLAVYAVLGGFDFGAGILYRIVAKPDEERRTVLAALALAPVLLAVVFGATFGTLVRGVPLGKHGLPGMSLFTNFRPGREAGILDWYTGRVSIFMLAALADHGALYL
jgi:cytochrome bd-type quinol oxidase subunit 2